MVGPSFKGLFGKTEPLEDGEVKVDDAYLIESIAEPAAKVVKGFAPSMPAYKFSEDEMANILAFIKSLK